jgi:hypothetical protein
MRDARKLLAASFVVTVSAGCDARSSAPATIPTVNVPAASAGPAPSATPSVTAAATPSTVPTTPIERVLTDAPATGRVLVNADGTCTWFSDAHCPPSTSGRIIHCNPPPPRPVKCPDAGP